VVLDQDEFHDDQRARILPLILGGRDGRRGLRTDNRRFINALLWMARSGARWKDLPRHSAPFKWSSGGMIDGWSAVLADRAFDADLQMDAILDKGAEPVIPPRRHRRHQHAYDQTLLKEKERNVLQQAQTVPTGRHTLRQAPHHLYGLSSTTPLSPSGGF
jgi:transposase